jgi:N-acetyl-gamma-glutamyl-phosphate reductase
MKNISIIGGSGYSGAELLRLLAKRDDIAVKQVIAHTYAGTVISDLYPDLYGRMDSVFEPIDALSNDGVDLIFLAVPSGEAMDIIPKYIGESVRVIDLGGDLRLSSPEAYERYYGKPHSNPGLLDESVYGLPEIYRNDIAAARLIANPGCYPTSVILPLYPLLREGVIGSSGIVINSLSGTSGAGRKAVLDLSFSEVNENVRAYRITDHQHIPEMRTVLDNASGRRVSFSFVPHLLPLTRGIYTTIHAPAEESVDERKLNEIYSDYYGSEPFVRLVPRIPRIKDVAGTNYCDIHCTVQRETGQVILLSVIDNILKGAAGQAVQNMNIMFSLPETRGLL